MKFSETKLKGAFVCDPEPIEDARGFLANLWNRDDFRGRGLNAEWVHSLVSFNKKKGTVRGMHFQAPPHEETKLVRCTRGRIFDVVVDLRPASPTYKAWFGAELSAETHRMIYVPVGFAHGYQTLQDDTEVFYLVSAFYRPESARGHRPDDPAFKIAWPLAISVISKRDAGAPDFKG